MSKVRKPKTETTTPPARVETRLVSSDTPHGTFLQFANVTVAHDGRVLAVDTKPQYVFESEAQACHYAQALFGATHAPVVNLKRTMTTTIH